MKLLTLLLAPALLSQAGGKLVIKDVTFGRGMAAQAGDLVTLEYTGTLKGGKQFDSTKGKAPYSFTLGKREVIKGWDQGLVGMKVGGKRHLVIPPNLGYGAVAQGTDIPANSTLVFDVILFRIEKSKDKPKVEVTVLKGGHGPAAKAGDSVDVHYVGTFLNGVKFDSSRDRNQPLSVVIGKTSLIKGFTQGLVGMKLGEKRRVVIPSGLAYGPAGRSSIPPNEPLAFELELLKLTKGEGK